MNDNNHHILLRKWRQRDLFWPDGKKSPKYVPSYLSKDPRYMAFDQLQEGTDEEVCHYIVMWDVVERVFCCRMRMATEYYVLPFSSSTISLWQYVEKSI